ncbi:MAG: hypothetical protein M3Q93_12540 [Gemmatimonadota bacterium]|nr:hypothetical protein [Gemmatimonadales bacterium]MDQ3138397.1 hypothetical protein [Gemmatimonadota bacterium]
MPRTLTMSRVRVRAGAEGDYLAAIRELAALHEARGRHLWVFRGAGRPGRFLECSESRDADTHRTVAPATDGERRLEARIRAVAEYEPEAWDLWEEVRSES